YFKRSRGHKKVRIRERPGTVAFARRYHELLAQCESGGHRLTAHNAPKPGTFRWLCVEHFKSIAFQQGLDPRTQHVTRLIVEKMFAEPIAPGAKETFADCPLERLDVRAIKILRDRRADKREAANNRVRRLRRIFAWALEEGISGVRTNPARDVKLLK